MANRPLPSQEHLNSLLLYEAETGKLFWKEQPRETFPSERIWRAWNARCADREAFTAATPSGYRVGSIKGVNYYAHRLIFRMVTGEAPQQIDHINGDTADNRFANLRSATSSVNHKNAARRSDNVSGCTGVCWLSRDRKWRAWIGAGRKNITLGEFDSREDAIAARKAAESVHGFHPNHDRVVQV